MLFTAFASSILLLTLSTAILVSLFWIGIALALLIPTLFITFGLATVFFSWILIGKWAYGIISKSTPAARSEGKAKLPVDEKKDSGGLKVDTMEIETHDMHGLTNGHDDEVSTS